MVSTFFAVASVVFFTSSSDECGRAVSMIVFGSMFYVLSCRSLVASAFSRGFLSNRWLWAGIAAMAVVQVAFVRTTWFNRFFHTTPLDPGGWYLVLGVGAAIFAIVEFEKSVRRWMGASPTVRTVPRGVSGARMCHADDP